MNIFLTLAAMVAFNSASADTRFTLNCDRVFRGSHFLASITIDPEGNSSVFILGSNNTATRLGQQSEGPVGGQLFSKTLMSPPNEIEIYRLKKPIADRTRNEKIDFKSVRVSENDDGTYSATIQGPALARYNFLTLGKITFSNCSIRF